MGRSRRFGRLSQARDLLKHGDLALRQPSAGEMLGAARPPPTSVCAPSPLPRQSRGSLTAYLFWRSALLWTFALVPFGLLLVLPYVDCSEAWPPGRASHFLAAGRCAELAAAGAPNGVVICCMPDEGIGFVESECALPRPGRRLWSALCPRPA